MRTSVTLICLRGSLLIWVFIGRTSESVIYLVAAQLLNVMANSEISAQTAGPCIYQLQEYNTKKKNTTTTNKNPKQQQQKKKKKKKKKKKTQKTDK